MTSKERVFNAWNHEETDRVPMDMGGVACEIVDDTYLKLKEALGIPGELVPYRRGKNTCYYDERILKALDVDFRRVLPKVDNKYPMENNGILTDEWGIQRKKGKFGMEFVGNPLEDAEVEDLDDYPWPKASEILDIEGLRETAKRLHEENEYAVSLRAPLNGIFEIACWLRGMENYMCDMLADEEFADALAEKVLEVQLDWYGYLLDAVGPYVDMVETGDDYGTQNSLLMSPDCLKHFILPRRKRLNDLIHEKAPQAKVFFHCCGSIKSIINDLKDTGVDILNPIQTTAADMEPADLKAEFGDGLVFHGGIDTTKALPGSIEDVEKEVRKMVDGMKGNGGYIFASCNNIQKDVPPENIIRMFEYAKEYSSK